MIRKWLMVLISLLLAVMLPAAALADVQHTLRIVPGDMLASEEAVADLLDALSVTLTTGSQSGALTLNLENTPIASVGMSADRTGLYVQSSLLSDDVLYVTWDDGFAFLTGIMQSALASEGAETSELELLETTMNEAKSTVVTVIGSDLAPSVGITDEATAIEVMEQLFPDDPAMIDYIKGVYSRMKVEEGSFAADAHDAASQKITLTMTAEDLLALCETAYLRTILTEIAKVDSPEAGADEIAATVDEMIEEIRELYQNSDMNYVVTVYQNEGEEMPVSMVLDMTMTVREEDESTTAAMKMEYNRLTGADGVTHTAGLTMGDGTNEMVEMLFELSRGYDAVSEGQLSFLADGEEITFLYRAENREADTRMRTVALYLRSGAVAILPPAASDRPLIAFEVETSPADPEVLEALENADASTSVNVMKLSAEEMEALGQEISTRSMQAMYTALGNLPTSVLQLVMGMVE